MSLSTVRTVLIIFSYFFSYFLAVYFGYIYVLFTTESLGGSFIPADAAQWMVGLPLALVALVTFSLHGVSGKRKWWWIIISLTPAILFEVFIDPFHLYIPLLVGLVAWGLGTLANKALRQVAPRFMAKIS